MLAIKEKMLKDKMINGHINIKIIKHELKLKKIGEITLIETKYQNNIAKLGRVKLEAISTYKNQRGKGLSKELYKLFGQIYKEKFNGYEFEVFFANPIAEYGFLKSIENGDLPYECIEKGKIKRAYDEKDELWRKLKCKLEFNLVS